MKRVIAISVLFLSVWSASAEVKKSSRNLEPLSKRSGSSTASTRSGNSGLNVATPQSEKPQEPVTQITFLGPKSGWGFVQATSPCYTPQGKNVGKLPGGTLFKYTNVKASSKNPVLVCSVKQGENWEGPFLLDCTDVATYEGTPETIDPETIKNLGSYFTLKGKIADRKEALADALRSANPYFESAKKTQQAYQDSIEKAAEMEQQLLALSGARKTKADEALRTLKYDQVRIKAKADAEAAAYKTWKEAHPTDPAKLTSDPQLQALEQELQAAKAKVANLIPTP